MAGSSLLTLLDDIATLLDDIAVMTKLAAKKTAGVLGDDLALNAQQVAGVQAERELPVVWAVAKGSLLNKLILVPAALLISALAPWLVTPLLMVGGAFLCYEGFEKLAHRLIHGAAGEDVEHAELSAALVDPNIDLAAFERDKIRGAIRTDFILSAEIIAIALGTVAQAAFVSQVVVLVGVSLIVTFGVYGLVAAIVKLDDLGLYLTGRPDVFLNRLGRMLLSAAPQLMKGLSVVGTAAMFLVGGGILVHGLPFLAHGLHGLEASAGALPSVGSILSALLPTLANALIGIVAGALVLLGVTLFGRLSKAFAR